MKVRSRRRSIRRRTLLLGTLAIVGIFVFITRFPSTFRLVELRIDDLRMYARPNPKPAGAVAIVAIDDASIATYGRWPWPRQRIAQLVSALNDYGVKVIGLDLVLSEADDSPGSLVGGAATGKTGVSMGDLALANALAKQGMVFLGTAFDVASEEKPIARQAAADLDASQQITMRYSIVREHGDTIPNIVVAASYLHPLPVIAEAARGGGFINILHDEDQNIRSALLVLRYHNHYYAPLSLALTSSYLDNAPLSLDLGEEGVRGISVGSINIPVDESGHMLINFRGPAGSFARYSAADVIAGRVPSSALKGRIVVVGADALGLGDVVSTPRGDLLHGVEVHATLIDQFLSRNFVRRSTMTAGEELVATILLTLAAIVMVAYLSAARASLGGLLILGIYVAYAQYRLVVDHVLVGVGIPILAVLLIYTLLASYRYFREGSERQHLRALFEHYLHPDVIAQMADDPEGIKLGGQRRHLAILFADIVNFTARAERTAPEALVEMLDTYMTDMTDAIMESRGVVDKLMGDGIMAFWGAPLDLPNPAKSAIDCALTMLQKLDQLRAEDPRFADLNIGIGIHVGDAIVGNFGGARRFDYSIIGDAVNFASRLEALTRHFGVRLLVSRQSCLEAGHEYLTREVGRVKVKGKSEAVEILEISNSPASDADFFRRYSAVISELNPGSANGEVVALERLLQERPGDQVTRLWIAKLKANPNFAAADLVFEFETK